jgi:UDP-N-acetylglucosamine 4-epimerase
LYETPFHTEPVFPYTFLVTGGAGFIGSHLVEYLLKYGARQVRVLDNLLTVDERNVTPFQQHPAYEFLLGDIRDMDTCIQACEGIDYVLHEAALGSVPRSILDPVTTHDINATGFLKLLCAAKQKKVKRVVYASSSSVYGDDPALPKIEDRIGNPLSPYAVSKYSNEQYAGVFAKTDGMELIGLRYFNIFGPRQSPDGPYAAVIPAFIRDLENATAPVIYGDGLQSRDFTYVENAVQANIKALFIDDPNALNQVYNVAMGEQYTVLELFEAIRKLLGSNLTPRFLPARDGDILHSRADISKGGRLLNYRPTIGLEKGLSIVLNKS